ncbi:transposase [Streptomyces sp. cmx-18-6]|uniref:transposase n=1 Tax=Streptomyces sp. cmx-18-6 TaxID=2790930 RepID=UPI00397EEE62
MILTGGNRNDVTQLLPLIDAIPPVRGRVGHRRRKPDSLFADRGYATTSTATRPANAGSCRPSPAVAPPTAQDWAPTGWVVGRTFAWLHGVKRLRIRWERRADIHEAFLNRLLPDHPPTDQLTVLAVVSANRMSDGSATRTSTAAAV